MNCHTIKKIRIKLDSNPNSKRDFTAINYSFAEELSSLFIYVVRRIPVFFFPVSHPQRPDLFDTLLLSNSAAAIYNAQRRRSQIRLPLIITLCFLCVPLRGPGVLRVAVNGFRVASASLELPGVSFLMPPHWQQLWSQALLFHSGEGDISGTPQGYFLTLGTHFHFDSRKNDEDLAVEPRRSHPHSYANSDQKIQHGCFKRGQ